MEVRRPVLMMSLLGVAVLCVGARRVGGFGCGGSLPRSLSVAGGGAESPSFIDDDSRTTTVSFLDLGEAFSPFDELRWRGDSSSYVDVFFDTPLVDPTATPPILGIEYAPFVRYEYGDERFSDYLQIEQPVATATALGLPVPFSAATAFRFYDRGSCSGETRWRTIGEAFASALDDPDTIAELVARINEATQGPTPDICNLVPIGNWGVTPRLSEEFATTLDTFEFVRQFGGQLCGGGNLNPIPFRIRGRFYAEDRELRFRLVALDVAGEPVAGGDISSFVEGTVNAAIPSAIAQVVTFPGSSSPVVPCDDPGTPDATDRCVERLADLLPRIIPGVDSDTITAANVTCLASGNSGGCAFIPNVYRVNHRPEGIEVVVSEGDRGTGGLPQFEEPDVFQPLLIFAGVCPGRGERPRVRHSTPVRVNPASATSV